MSDLERLKDFLKQAGVEYTVETERSYTAALEVTSGDTYIKCEAGYPGFYTVFEFNPQGKLTDMGAYE